MFNWYPWAITWLALKEMSWARFFQQQSDRSNYLANASLRFVLKRDFQNQGFTATGLMTNHRCMRPTLASVSKNLISNTIAEAKADTSEPKTAAYQASNLGIQWRTDQPEKKVGNLILSPLEHCSASLL